MSENDPMQSFKCVCLRCGHEWFKRVAYRPQVCSMCGTRKWDIPFPEGHVPRGTPKIRPEKVQEVLDSVEFKAREEEK